MARWWRANRLGVRVGCKIQRRVDRTTWRLSPSAIIAARGSGQLIGKKAKSLAEVLDREGGERGRVVLGLCGMTPQDKPGKGGVIATVWDPKEECRIVLRPDHPLALKL